MYRDVLYIFATSGGVRALTSVFTKPGEKAWPRYVAATHKCSAATETSSLYNHGKEAQEIQASCLLATRSVNSVHDKNYAAAIFYACALRARALDAPRDHAIFWAEQSSGLNALF